MFCSFESKYRVLKLPIIDILINVKKKYFSKEVCRKKVKRFKDIHIYIFLFLLWTCHFRKFHYGIPCILFLSIQIQRKQIKNLIQTLQQYVALPYNYIRFRIAHSNTLVPNVWRIARDNSIFYWNNSKFVIKPFEFSFFLS